VCGHGEGIELHEVWLTVDLHYVNLSMFSRRRMCRQFRNVSVRPTAHVYLAPAQRRRDRGGRNAQNHGEEGCRQWLTIVHHQQLTPHNSASPTVDTADRQRLTLSGKTMPAVLSTPESNLSVPPPSLAPAVSTSAPAGTAGPSCLARGSPLQGCRCRLSRMP